MNSSSNDNAANDLNFEQAMAELEAIVRRLENGEESLEGAIASYERGAALHKRLAALLENARMRIAQITIDEDGQVLTTPFEQAE
ncbi:MAG: exodeoxyribonuclease VII small subunit [Pseudomonadota bacterium]